MIKRLIWYAVVIFAVTTWVSRSQAKRNNAVAEEDHAKADWESEGGSPAPDAT